MKPVQPPMPDLSTPASFKNPKSPIEVGMLVFTIIAGLILLAVGAIAGYTFYIQSQTPISSFSVMSPTPQPTQVVDEMANWKTYTNSKYSFSLQHPNSIEVVSDNNQSDNIQNDAFYAWIGENIQLSVLPGKIPPCRGDCPLDESAESFVIDGIEGDSYFGYFGSMMGQPQRYKRVEVYNKVYTYTFTLYALDRDNDFPFDDTKIYDIPKENVAEFDQILSTFKFLDSNPQLTCTPRPACLDSEPRCLMPETQDMCPPKSE